MFKRYFLSPFSALLIAAFIFVIGWFVVGNFLPPNKTPSPLFNTAIVILLALAILAGYSFYKLGLKKDLKTGLYWMIFYFGVSNIIWYWVARVFLGLAAFGSEAGFDFMRTTVLAGYVVFTYAPVLIYAMRKIGVSKVHRVEER
jgi:hypothetical protein